MGLFKKARQLKTQLGNAAGGSKGNADRNNYPREVAVLGAKSETIAFIQQTNCRYIAEVGIFKGQTSLEFAKYLNGEGELHLFDFDDRVAAVAAELNAAGYPNIRTFGCSYKLLDSYNWSLANLIEQNPAPIYDYVFLDGAHTWAIDALTTFLVDRLLNVGGYLDLDDYDWTLRASPSQKPKVFPLTAKLFTDEQIAAKQVKMIADLILRRDPRYREVVANKIFQKIA